VVEIGKQYRIWVPSEPVAKTTMRPPQGDNAYWIVQNMPKYKRLKRTWAYQDMVAQYAMSERCPKFGADDPIALSATIRKSGHKTGDLKNIVAAIEDGLQRGGFIPDDRQVTAYKEVLVVFGCGKESAGVMVTLEIDPRAVSLEWLAGWLQSKKKAIQYQGRYGV